LQLDPTYFTSPQKGGDMFDKFFANQRDRNYTLMVVLGLLQDDFENWDKYTSEDAEKMLVGSSLAHSDVFGYYHAGKPAISIIPNFWYCLVYVEGVRYCFWFFEGAHLLINLLYPSKVNCVDAINDYCDDRKNFNPVPGL
jgi:hypothetical protein